MIGSPFTFVLLGQVEIERRIGSTLDFDFQFARRHVAKLGRNVGKLLRRIVGRSRSCQWGRATCGGDTRQHRDSIRAERQTSAEMVPHLKIEEVLSEVLGAANCLVVGVPDERMRVKLDTVKGRKPYPISMMPPGLINSLNPEELKNLVAYLLSAGNPADPLFGK